MLEIQQLAVNYRGVSALDRIDWPLESGAITSRRGYANDRQEVKLNSQHPAAKICNRN